ncbi:hypothetical protein D6D01_03666 [Aureobasidium pullulans]|uniref:DUF1989 domain-containing protein n=1 Tax=Aureobasidium pullulans TaxID=5580 RepID=A0A4S9LJ87_AURPU|nr:hypothetical protein D6D01_03666 [Aureobasidium pullulans]
MSSTDDLQTIPARHGTATFVPKGSTIKIVNTSGTQVIDTWAFALPTPPKKKGPQEDAQDEQDKSYQEQDEKEKLNLAEEEDKKQREEEKKKQEEEEKKKREQEEKDKASKKKGNRKSRGGLDLPSQEEAEAATSQQQQAAEAEAKQQSTPTKSSWSSYLPSLRGRKQITDGNAKDDSKASEQKEDTADSTEVLDKSQEKENSRRWGSYLLKGQGVTSYLPSKGTISAFAAQHARDPNKTYAEQLADFSRTPVGAASLSAITGSGSVSSLYAGYSAWNAMHGDTAQMEYLSMPHTRASTLHMVPRVNDVLVSNLREPMLTLVEDTSSGVHDTLIPACDPQRYKALQIEDWEQHGSCAENLVLALKELNDRAGLKGPKGVGASVTVNSVPAPLNLFMNIPWRGDKGDLSFEAPKCKEGDYVRFKAERDVVVIMSACPNDVQQINKGQSKDGHFLVEHADDDSDEETPEEAKKADKKKPRKLGKKDDTKPDEKEKSEKSEEPKKKLEEPKKKLEEPKKKPEKISLPPTPAIEKSEAASSPAPKPKSQPKKDKPEEQKKAEKVPLPETPATEKSEAAAAPAPAPPKQLKGKPKKLADEEQKKAEKTPLPETPAVEKPESAASPAPAPASSSSTSQSTPKPSSTGQSTPKPKGKPKKLIDSSTGEKKKPRKLESRAKVELQSQSEDEVITREGDPRDGRDTKEVAVDQEMRVRENENEEHEEEQDDLDEEKNEASNSSLVKPNNEEETDSVNEEVSDKVKNIGVRALGSLVNGGLAFIALGARSPVGLLLKRFDDMKEAEEAQYDDQSEGEAETKTDDANDL